MLKRSARWQPRQPALRVIPESPVPMEIGVSLAFNAQFDASTPDMPPLTPPSCSALPELRTPLPLENNNREHFVTGSTAPWIDCLPDCLGRQYRLSSPLSSAAGSNRLSLHRRGLVTRPTICSVQAAPASRSRRPQSIGRCAE
jgi:hypothetical protein